WSLQEFGDVDVIVIEAAGLAQRGGGRNARDRPVLLLTLVHRIARALLGALLRHDGRRARVAWEVRAVRVVRARPKGRHVDARLRLAAVKPGCDDRDAHLVAERVVDDGS